MLRGLALRCNMITFQIESSPASDLSPGLVGRMIDDRDVPRADLVSYQLRGRALSIYGGAVLRVAVIGLTATQSRKDRSRAVNYIVSESRGSEATRSESNFSRRPGP
jgi:hypothetical protein